MNSKKDVMFKHELRYATEELHCASLFILYFLVHKLEAY